MEKKETNKVRYIHELTEDSIVYWEPRNSSQMGRKFPREAYGLFTLYAPERIFLFSHTAGPSPY